MVIALPLLLLLVSCGTPNLGGGTSSSPTALYVTRISLIPENGFAPFQKRIKDVGMVQHLFNAALALPAVPSGGVKHTCLNDEGLQYQLVFQPSTLPSSQVELEPSGCQLLYIGVKKTDVRQMDSTFLSFFARTIQVTWLSDPSL